MLGGGHAVALHGMGSRPSEDVDLFSDRRGSPGEVADDVAAAFTQAGLDVSFVRRTPDLVQLTVSFALLTVALEHNPGFDRYMFAESLSYLRQIPDRDFTPYGVAVADISAMRDRLADWESDLLR